MNILWRIAIQEEDTSRTLTKFSNKFGDDLVNDDQILERF